MDSQYKKIKSLTLKQIFYALAAADEGNVTAAARKLLLVNTRFRRPLMGPTFGEPSSSRHAAPQEIAHRRLSGACGRSCASMRPRHS
jgi:hypothetical protein